MTKDEHDKIAAIIDEAVKHYMDYKTEELNRLIQYEVRKQLNDLMNSDVHSLISDLIRTNFPRLYRSGQEAGAYCCTTIQTHAGGNGRL